MTIAEGGKYQLLNSLTRHERDVAKHIANGLNNRAIAKIISVNAYTVASLVVLIADKLERPEGYSSRVWIARAVWEQCKNNE